MAYGRAALLVAAGLAFIEAMVYGVLGESIRTLAFCLTVSAIMVVLFFVGRRQPLAAMVAGAAVYVFLQVLAMIVSLEAPLQGIVVKVLIIITLTGGISAEFRRR